MFGTIGKILLTSQARRENQLRQKKFLPWDQIEKIALILERSENINKSAIDKFIDGTKKYIEVFYIETDSPQSSFTDWHCFNKKDRSLWQLPKKATRSGLQAKSFDAVINTCSESNLFAQAVCSVLPARLKCSGNEGFNLADLVIKRTHSANLLNYLADTVTYLKMIRV